MSIEISLLIGVIGTLIGVIGALATFKKNNRNEGATQASLTSKVDYIARGVDDIRLDLRAQASKIEILNEKVIRNEESTKQAHKRIDELGGKNNEN